MSGPIFDFPDPIISFGGFAVRLACQAGLRVYTQQKAWELIQAGRDESAHLASLEAERSHMQHSYDMLDILIGRRPDFNDPTLLIYDQRSWNSQGTLVTHKD